MPSKKTDAVGANQLKTAADLLKVREEVAQNLGTDAVHDDVTVGCCGETGPRGGLDAITEDVDAGSIAALWMTVRPSAKTPRYKHVAVAPTLGYGRVIWAP